MKAGKMRAWRIPLFVFLFVCVGILTFVTVQFWSKGHLRDSEIIEMTLSQTLNQSTGRAALMPQNDEPYHYDFFSLLEQPVPDRALKELELAQNPALKAKARHGLYELRGKFAVQVSSFKTAADAQTLVRQLNVQGYHAVVTNDSSEGGWYRVRVDGGSKREQAENLQANIEKRTGLKGFVVSL